MDRARAAALLGALERGVGGGTLLWRGAELTGSDIDLVVLHGSEERLESILRE